MAWYGAPVRGRGAVPSLRASPARAAPARVGCQPRGCGARPRDGVERLVAGVAPGRTRAPVGPGDTSGDGPRLSTRSAGPRSLRDVDVHLAAALRGVRRNRSAGPLRLSRTSFVQDTARDLARLARARRCHGAVRQPPCLARLVAARRLL